MSLYTKLSSVVSKHKTLSNIKAAGSNSTTGNKKEKRKCAALVPPPGPSTTALIHLFKSNLAKLEEGNLPGKVRASRSTSVRDLPESKKASKQFRSNEVQTSKVPSAENFINDVQTQTQKKRNKKRSSSLCQSSPLPIDTDEEADTVELKVEKAVAAKSRSKINKANTKQDQDQEEEDDNLAINNNNGSAPSSTAKKKTAPGPVSKVTSTELRFVSALSTERKNSEDSLENVPPLVKRIANPFQRQMIKRSLPVKASEYCFKSVSSDIAVPDSNANLDPILRDNTRKNSRTRSRVAFSDDTEEENTEEKDTEEEDEEEEEKPGVPQAEPVSEGGTVSEATPVPEAAPVPQTEVERKVEKMKSMMIVSAVKATTGENSTEDPTGSNIVTCEHASLKMNGVMNFGNSPLATDLPQVASRSRTGSLPSFRHRHRPDFPAFINPEFRQCSDACFNRHPARSMHSQRPPPRQRGTTAKEEDFGLFANTAVADFIHDLLREDSGSQSNTTDGSGEGATATNDEGAVGYVVAAYNIFISVLDYLFRIIGYEKIMEPQEDFVRYNGYKIKVFGKELLLESVHVNRDFQVDSKSGTCCRSTHSLYTFQPHTLSTECVRQQNQGECNAEGRVRIVVRINGASTCPLGPDGSIIGMEYHVVHEHGKWTFHITKLPWIKVLEEDDKDNTDKENYVQIGCPTGVHPETLEYGLMNGLLYIDAP